MPHLLLRVAPVLETHLAVVHPGRDRRRGPELPAEPRADSAVVGRGQRVGGRREAPPGAEGGAAVLWTSFFARSGERGVFFSFSLFSVYLSDLTQMRPGETGYTGATAVLCKGSTSMYVKVYLSDLTQTRPGETS